MNLPDDVKAEEVSISYTQPNDSCDADTMGQSLKVYTQDAGGGSYICIETERWAVSDLDDFIAVLKDFQRRSQPVMDDPPGEDE